MDNSQTIIIISIGLIFASCWFYSLNFALKSMKDGENGSLYVLASIVIGVLFGIIMSITITSTAEMNNMRKKSPQPEYEKVTFTVYKKK